MHGYCSFQSQGEFVLEYRHQQKGETEEDEYVQSPCCGNLSEPFGSFWAVAIALSWLQRFLVWGRRGGRVVCQLPQERRGCGHAPDHVRVQRWPGLECGLVAYGRARAHTSGPTGRTTHRPGYASPISSSSLPSAPGSVAPSPLGKAAQAKWGVASGGSRAT